MMRYSSKNTIIPVIFLTVFLALPVVAQNNAAERAASLRSQLAETQSQEAELQTRLLQLEGDLKSENIERSLAGVGSTHPEELREARRRQLEIERKSVESQLALLMVSRSRLEAATTRADNESYYESAGIKRNGQRERNEPRRIRKHGQGRPIQSRMRTP